MRLVLPVPNLPEFDEAAAVCLCTAAELKLVTRIGNPGAKLAGGQLRRWAEKGCEVVTGGQWWRFPAAVRGKELVTCPAWCTAWNEWIARILGTAA